jgi:hypothetical protein
MARFNEVNYFLRMVNIGSVDLHLLTIKNDLLESISRLINEMDEKELQLNKKR